MNRTKTEKHMWLLWGIVAICATEYIGGGQYIPGVQRILVLLSLFIFICAFLSNKGPEVLRHAQTKAFMVYLLHTALSLSYAIVGSNVLKVFISQIGYIILFVSTYLVLKSKKEIRLFIASFVVFHVFVVFANLDKLIWDAAKRTGGFRAGYFMGDGNDLGWSLITFLPFAIYLFAVARNNITKGLMIAAIGLLVIGLFGTGSRGAFLGISAAVVYLVLNSRKTPAAFVVAGIIMVLAYALAPQAYIDRMRSIENYEEDSSALARIMAWKASVRMAMDHPLGVGAGNFPTAYGRFYRPKLEDIDPRIYAGMRWIAPHSIYFLVLGEYGFPGLITVLSLLAFNYRDNQRQVVFIKRMASRKSFEKPLDVLPKYLNMSLIAFSVGGIFLGGINYPHIFILTAIIMKTKQINKINSQLETPH